MAVRNSGTSEYPLIATVAVGGAESTSGEDSMTAHNFDTQAKKIQGGAIKTFTFGANVESVQVLLTTNGLPLNARIELLQGPNNIKQTIDLYTDDGVGRPFYAIFETPGGGNVFRIVNTSTMEYPLSAAVGPLTRVPGSVSSLSTGADMKQGDSDFFFLNQQ